MRQATAAQSTMAVSANRGCLLPGGTALVTGDKPLPQLPPGGTARVWGGQPLSRVAVALATALLAGSGARAEEAAAPAEALRPVAVQQVRVRGFWKEQVKRLTEKWIPHCVRQMEAGGRGQELLNFVHAARALKGEAVGKFTGCPWSDAYIYNTIEAICLALAYDPEGDAALAAAQAALRRKVDEWIPIVLAAQLEDGYLHTFHTVNKRPRFTKVGDHEFYVMGYLIEAGVAHHRATGGKDRRLYDAARRCADLLCATFGPPPKRTWVNGHPGMEHALFRLAWHVDATEGAGQGAPYAALARWFLDHHHEDPAHRNPYMQSHLPLSEQAEAVGHAVRATYLYTAAADYALLPGGAAYGRAADRLWESAVDRKLYLTGGVGASHEGEAFDKDFELRNDGYCESCAGCGLSFWAEAMLRRHGRGHYADVQERVLYNNILGAIELTGVNFFYQNPLRSDKARYPWHGCPCCVGNIPRALLAIKDLAFSTSPHGDALAVNHYLAGAWTIPGVGGTTLGVEQETEYPWKGDVAITLRPAAPSTFTLMLRIPDRAGSALYSVVPDTKGRFTVAVNGAPAEAEAAGGYARIRRAWKDGDRVALALPMEVQRVRCDARVAANRGRVALQRGPIVYSVEDVDHEGDASALVLGPGAALRVVWKADLLGGVMAIEGDAPRLLAIPNYARLNRGGGSRVWIVEDPAAAAPEGRVGPLYARKALAPRTRDQVRIGNAASEREHDLQGERTSSGEFEGQAWRHATDGGWFGYELAVDPAGRNALLCTYWGDDGGNRRFRVVVEGETVARQVLERSKPGEFFDVEVAIPDKLTRGKTKVRVRLEAEAGATAGGIFDLRVMKAGG